MGGGRSEAGKKVLVFARQLCDFYEVCLYISVRDFLLINSNDR